MPLHRLRASTLVLAVFGFAVVAACAKGADDQTLTRDALSESVGEAPADANDIAAVEANVSADVLMLRVRFARPPVRGHTWGTFVLFDTDLNRKTGFTAGPLGVDFLAQVDGDFSPILLLHRRKKGNDNDAFQGWEPPDRLQSAVSLDTADGQPILELRIPWSALGVADAKSATLRFRVCDSSPFLQNTAGEWSPDLPEGFFSLGSDPKSFATLPDVLTNGGFEALDDARAVRVPTGWAFYQPDNQTSVTVVDRSDVGVGEKNPSSGHAVRISVDEKRSAGLNATPISARHGVVTFRYRIDKSSVGARNLGLQVIGLRGGGEVSRVSYSPPAVHVGDGQWHAGSLVYRLPSGASQAMVAFRVNEGTPAAGPADWTVDDVRAFAVPEGIAVGIANLWVAQPRLHASEATEVVAFIENTGGRAVEGFTVRLETNGPVAVTEPSRLLPRVDETAFVRVAWPLRATGAGAASLRVVLEPKAAVENDSGEGKQLADYEVLVLPADERCDRAEVNTDERGFWRRLPRPLSLQEGNPAPLQPIEIKRSDQIGHSPFGVCAQLPRQRDYETPFDLSHLIDGDPATVWSSQQRNNAFPGDPPVVTIRLARPAEVTRVDLVPYWNNTDFPRGFHAAMRLAGTPVGQPLVVSSHELQRGGERRGDKFVQQFVLREPTRLDSITFTFDRLPQSGGNYAEVSTGYKARLADIELIDAGGRNVALASVGATAEASDVFTAWQNTAANVERAFGRIFDLGLKWVRVGQWGDQTEWAAVERTRGRFAMDPSTDTAIQTLAANGVDVLWGLMYGNQFYHDANDNPENRPAIDIGPIFVEGGPFNRNSGPRTEEARQAFLRYVEYVVGRYHKQVRFWELWNEENGWFPGHEPDLYGKLLAVVGKKVKEVDPTAKFSFGGTAAPAPVTSEIALRGGGAPYVDIAAFHPYGIDKPEGGMGTMELYQGKSVGRSKAETGWNTLPQVLAGVREPFARHGRPGVEVWMNEFGTNVAGRDFAYNPGLGEYASAKWLIRMYVYGAWCDSRSAWWALHTDNRSQDWGILDPKDFSLRPMALGLRNVCSTLSDCRPIAEPVATLRTEAADPKCVSFLRDGGKETLTAVWAADTVDDRARTYRGEFEQRCSHRPADVEIVDLYWGQRQQARYEWADGKLRLAGLTLRDYPLVICVRE